MDEDVVVRLAGVNHDFPDPAGGKQDFRVLSDVDLEVREGEFVVLVGKSGCGKTTLLNVIAGLIRPLEGEVSVLGTSALKARERMGYMFARDALLPWRRAVRNVEFALEMSRRHNLTRKEARARAEAELAKVHLEGKGGLFPWQLSQGMRQRVAIARTWVTDPQLLLMDEPFAALDAQTRASVQREFLDMWSAHRKSVVFITHDLEEALTLADRVIVMVQGRIAAEFQVPFERPRSMDELTVDVDFRRLHREMAALIQ